MEDLGFTEDEIKEQLKHLGYNSVSTDQLREFKKDLENLVRHERSKNSSWSTVSESAQSRESDDNIYIYRPQTVPEASSTKPFSYYQTQSRPTLGQYNEESHVRTVPQPKQAFSGPEMSHGVPILSDHTNGVAEDSEVADTTLNTTTSTERRIMKRKVLRKVDGKSQVFDESSVTESDFTDDLSEVEDRLRDMPFLNERPKTAPSGERRRIYGIQPSDRPHTARETPSYGVPDDYDGPKALIKPMTSHPHARNIQKMDVVSRGQQYRQSWNCQRAPGEKVHKSLRWNVREQMLYHDKVVDKKQQRVFIPNKYKIPSDKKRKNLRWQVRQDLAQGVIPPSIYE